MKEYYANYSRMVNDSEATPPPMDPSDVIRGPCWETAVGIVMKIKTALLFYMRQKHKPHLLPKCSQQCVKWERDVMLSNFYVPVSLLLNVCRSRSLLSWQCRTSRCPTSPSWSVTLLELSSFASLITAGAGTWRLDLWVWQLKHFSFNGLLWVCLKLSE